MFKKPRCVSLFFFELVIIKYIENGKFIIKFREFMKKIILHIF